MLVVLLGISSYSAILILRKLAQPLMTLAEKSVTLLDTLISSEPEDVKVKKVQLYTTGVLKYLVITLMILAFVVFIVFLPYVTYSFLYPKEAMIFSMFSWPVILSVSVGSTLGFLFPKSKFEGDFSPIIKLLHRLVLDNYHLHLKLHKREIKRCKANNQTTRNDFIIISGLARAGTTSLLNKLATHRNLKSFHYGNMPLLLAPNLWKRFYNPEPGELKERSHKDGIMVNNVSYEALEEYFFKVKSSDSFITEHSLQEYEVSAEDYQAYLEYQLLIRPNSEDRYLAKNNNFLIRYESLRRLNSEFKMVLMFREPLSHAASLLDKHIQYSESQTNEVFELEYMNWLGHHEFGLGHKVFEFKDFKKFVPTEKDQFSLDYWLQVWINYYTKVLSITHRNVLFVCYENYCSEPELNMSRIFKFLNLESSQETYSKFTPKRKVDYHFTDELAVSAKEVYAQLKKNTC